MPEIETEGFEELRDIIDLLPKLALEAARDPMLDAAIFLRSQIPGYPPKPKPGTASKFWTDKQRRWFWWQIGQGNKALFEYKRTGTLGRRITEGVETTQDAVTGFVSMGGTPYAPWVVGPDFENKRSFAGRGQMWQARVHRGRWWQFETIMDEHIDEASDRFVGNFWDNLTEVWSTEGV
jgi:hypothetical protein